MERALGPAKSTWPKVRVLWRKWLKSRLVFRCFYFILMCSA